MAERLATVEAELLAMRKDVDLKHQQNRSSIHDLRNGQQRTDDRLGVIHDMVQQVLGILKFGSVLSGMAAAAWTVMQIKNAISH